MERVHLYRALRPSSRQCKDDQIDSKEENPCGLVKASLIELIFQVYLVAARFYWFLTTSRYLIH